MIGSVRQPAVAGLFYESDAAALTATVRACLAAVTARGPRPKAVIAPHAGFVYSGSVAAAAYAEVAPHADAIERVVLVGPTHRVPLEGLAVPTAEAFRTPLGLVPLDLSLRDRLLQLPQVQISDAAHEREHSLEVHLPFLQTILGSFQLLPIVAGNADAVEVAKVMELAGGDDATLLVVSSDLSHYHDDATARRLDAETCRRIERLDPAGVAPDRACGCVAVNGLLRLSSRLGLTPRTLALGNSSDTAGPRDNVVGYGAWAFVPGREPSSDA